MANVLNRTTKIYLKSVNTPDYPESEWIINPAFVPGCKPKYIFINANDTLREMTNDEKAIVDYVAPPPEPTIPEARVIRQNEIKDECKYHILNTYPLEVQSSCSLGLYSTNVIKIMKTFIANCIIEENARYEEIELLVTLDEINAVTAIFPTE